MDLDAHELNKPLYYQRPTLDQFFANPQTISYSFRFAGAVGGDGETEDDKEKAEEEERERQEAIKEAEDRRKEKHRKMEEEREKMRQDIRDKVSGFVAFVYSEKAGQVFARAPHPIGSTRIVFPVEFICESLNRRKIRFVE